ncbi:unnamed protein product [Toxocara canis]|uniref:Uncharacterized protein n=1 Tax=Toxocara canis TaxID=6265 RepID=A0A183U8R1_TOXCA|nr:unnamed protein product [Toxocara canis]
MIREPITEAGVGVKGRLESVVGLRVGVKSRLESVELLGLRIGFLFEVVGAKMRHQRFCFITASESSIFLIEVSHYHCQIL